MREQERIESIKRNGGLHLRSFLKENITYKMCLAAVESDGRALFYVPKEYKTKEVYLIACSKSGKQLSSVPIEMIDYTICELSVKNDGMALAFVPNDYIDENLCRTAVTQNRQAFIFVPESIITPSFCCNIFKTCGYDALKSIPKGKKNTSFYKQLIEQLPELLWYVPKKHRTADVCKAAIKKMGYASLAEAVSYNSELFLLVPPSLRDHDSCYQFLKSELYRSEIRFDEGIMNMRGATIYEEYGRAPFILIHDYELPIMDLLKTTDLCELAVVSNPSMISYVPKELLTEDLCKKSVIGNWYSIRYVPIELCSKEICELAFRQSVKSIWFMPDEFKTKEMCLKAAELGYLSSIPDHFKTKEMCMSIINKEGWKITAVPKEFLDDEICIKAIETSAPYNILKVFPEECRSYRVCLAAVTKYGANIYDVPNHNKDYQMYLAAVKADPYTIKCVPTTMLTQEICDLAASQSITILKEIPEKFVTKEMLMHAAAKAPYLLPDHFPSRLIQDGFINILQEMYPAAANYISRIKA